MSSQSPNQPPGQPRQGFEQQGRPPPENSPNHPLGAQGQQGFEQQGRPLPGFGPNQPQPPYPYTPLQPSLRPRSTRGAKIMTFIGGGVLLVGVVSLVFAIIGFISILPTGIIDREGEPGPDALLSIDGVEPASLDSTGDVSYALWQVRKQHHDRSLAPADVQVTGPSGELVPVRGPSVSAHSSVSGVQSHTFAEFHAAQPGEYRVVVSAGTDADSHGRVIVAETSGFASFFSGVFGTTMLMITGIGGLILGFALTIAGAIWWRSASTHNKRLHKDTGMPRG